MISFFDNIYYWFYRGGTIIRTQEGYLAEDGASVLVAVLQIFNLSLLEMLVSAIIGKDLFKILVGDNIYTLVFGVCLIGGLFASASLRYYRKTHNIIIDKFENLGSKSKRKKRIIFFIYIVLSIGLYFELFNVLRPYYASDDEQFKLEKRHPNTDIMQLLDSTKIMQYKDSVK